MNDHGIQDVLLMILTNHTDTDTTPGTIEYATDAGVVYADDSGLMYRVDN